MPYQAARFRPYPAARFRPYPAVRYRPNQNGNDDLNYEQLLELEDRIGNVNKGYTEDQIDNIPIMYSFDEDNKQTCSICLDEIENGTPQLSIAWRHNFHYECIKKSLTINKIWPICKLDAINLS